MKWVCEVDEQTMARVLERGFTKEDEYKIDGFGIVFVLPDERGQHWSNPSHSNADGSYWPADMNLLSYAVVIDVPREIEERYRMGNENLFMPFDVANKFIVEDQSL